MAAPTLSRNAQNMQELGSGRAVIRQVNADGSLLSAAEQTAAGYGAGTPYGWMDLPIIKSSSLKDDTTINKKSDEGGDKYPFAGERDVVFEIVSMQREDTLLDSIVRDMRDKYFEIVKENSSRQLAAGYPYMHIAIAQIEPKLEFALPGGEPKLTFNILPVSVAIAARDLSTITGMRAPFTGVTSTLAVGDYYKRLSIAVP
jgi:hypothetical protein